MAKPVKSQWDFGELFPLEQTRKVLSVTELTRQIKRLLEKQVGEIWVTGEVTNLRSQSSGHIYFTLKDAGAQLNCVLFRGETQVDRSLLQDGRKVTLQGDMTVYEPRGQYQLRVTEVELQGIGALQAAFEKLKQRLKAEGLFAPERKRPCRATRSASAWSPRLPARPSGTCCTWSNAATPRWRSSWRRAVSRATGAAEEIAAAIRLLNEFNSAQLAIGNRQLAIDLILVTRGGGSLEDLWAFNEEVVARAIFESALPVVSAVGHEIDFTISDFVADVRAATPSAAAEIITEGVFSSCQFLSEAAQRIRQLARQQMEDKRYGLAQVAQRLARVHPRRRLNDWLQRLDDAQTSLLRCVKQGARRAAPHLAESLGAAGAGASGTRSEAEA